MGGRFWPWLHPGCGDWQSTQLINWGDAEYLGLDVVPSLISQNSEKFGPRYNFKLLDFSKSELPRADLALFKDVLQHWPTKTVLHLLPMLDVYKYVIITNSINGQAAINSDIAMAGYRPIDLRLPPFNFGAEELLRYKTDEVGQNDPPNKLVLLYRPQSSRA